MLSGQAALAHPYELLIRVTSGTRTICAGSSCGASWGASTSVDPSARTAGSPAPTATLWRRASLRCPQGFGTRSSLQGTNGSPESTNLIKIEFPTSPPNSVDTYLKYTPAVGASRSATAALASASSRSSIRSVFRGRRRCAKVPRPSTPLRRWSAKQILGPPGRPPRTGRPAIKRGAARRSGRSASLSRQHGDRRKLPVALLHQRYEEKDSVERVPMSRRWRRPRCRSRPARRCPED